MKAMRDDTGQATLHSGIRPGATLDPQAGVGILGVIAMLGLIFALVQGTVFFRAKASAKFMSTEKGKILAQQAAEAGVEENIADLGSRRLRPTAGMQDFVTYHGKRLGNSSYTTTLSTMGMGNNGDTIQLVSQGSSAYSSQTVRARMRIKNYVDTTLRPVMTIDIDTLVTNVAVTAPETTITTVVQDPETMPSLETTPAYASCMSSSAKKCDICHIPGGNPSNRHVINVSKSAIHTHISHHGDYVTTDGTCDIYNPREVRDIQIVTRMVPDTTFVDNTVYDTVVVVDTLSKVQILSWK